MRALVVDGAGSQPELADIPTPEAEPGTVRVKVRAAAINGVDVAIAGGMVAAMMEHVYPVVIGRDFAGVVDAVGQGVTHIAVGDEVMGNIPFTPPIQRGTLAEYAVVPVEGVSPKPAGLDFSSAAALPLAAAAAVAAVDLVDPQAGQVVLIVGATGGVGSYAVQLVAARGATVIATGLPEDEERLTGLGAGSVVDYLAGPIADQVRKEHPDGIDALIDLVSYGTDDLVANAAALHTGGKVSTTLGGADQDALAARGLTGGGIMANPVREVVAPLADQAAEGTLKVDVGETLALADAASGLQTLGSGQARGKIVVVVDAS